MGELPLGLAEPHRIEGRVGEEPEAEDGDQGRGGSLENEQPGLVWSATVRVHE